MSQVQWSGTKAELRKMLMSFVAGVAGKNADYSPYVKGVKNRIGMVALSCVQEAFVEKADGGTGDDGIKWEALKKATIAQRPISLSGPNNDRALLKSHGINPKAKTERGLLTPAQNKRWRQLFAQTRAWLILKHGMGAGEASSRAAQVAWATLKKEGAKTKLEVLGNRKVQIGRDTGRLFNSLSPGVHDPEQYPLLRDVPEVSERVLEEGSGTVTVGTNVAYAAKFHAKRPLWPKDLPQPWSHRIEDAARDGVLEAVRMIIEGLG
jgi:hypothetical protein